MSRIIGILSFLLLVVSSYAQLDFDQTKLDLGRIDRGDKRIVETYALYRGQEKLDLLRIDFNRQEIDVRLNQRTLLPGDSLRLRVKVVSNKKAPLNEKVRLFFTKETIEIQVKADVRYIDRSDQTPCPDFSRPANQVSSDWQAYFKVLDKSTGKAIPKAKIELKGMAGTQMQLECNRQGEVLALLPIDFYRIDANAENYASYGLESYINRRNKDFILELVPGQGSVLIRRPSQVEKPNDEQKQTEEMETSPKDKQEVEQGEFTSSAYKANNVVFLIDVSTSMRKEERITLLKESMIELAAMLRPQDVISVVTYATSTEVLISGEQVDEPAHIIELINSLEAEGKTAGEAGLKQAYKLCKKHLIPEGNNQVFIATDGAFHSQADRMKRLARAMDKKAMHLSVISIRSSTWVNKRMLELAESGGGQHLSIVKEEDRNGLKELIKSQSKR